MQWTDEGIVLGVRRHGEANVIVELLTRAHGRHLGLVRGGAGSRLRPVLQPGNSLAITWRARLDEHLGHYNVEGLKLRAGSFLTVAHAVYAVTHLSALLRLLPERDPHESLFDSLGTILDHLLVPADAAALTVHFELQLLSELGFGLDLDTCAATGAKTELVYVSPKTGRAVSRQAGEEFRAKLLALPAFLHDSADVPPSSAGLAEGFALTGFFLARHVFEPRGLSLPEARAQFIATTLRPAIRATA
jgi:DNA repair protein RecO (recombination protein O)